MTPDGKARLQLDEGSRPYAYWDKLGEPVSTHRSFGNPSIGVGRNIGFNGPGLRPGEISFMFANDIADCETEIMKALPWIVAIDAVWRDVLTMVHFNTGDVFAWHDLLGAMQAQDAQGAAAALLDSDAARDLPARYQRMANAIRNKAWKLNEGT